jgi:galactonate dehydratase
MNRPWKVDEKTGYATIPEGPGLGIEIDEAKLTQVAADPKYKWRWPGASYADGSVADY